MRPEHDGSAEWLLNLGQILSTQAVAETIDGDSFLYVLTWYIDHQRHTACRSPRPLRLDSASVAWIDEFRHLWRDLMDRRAVFSIYVVHPRPPQPRFQDYACHVLIEQNKLPGISAGVLTALLEGSNRDAMIQGAFSTPRFLWRLNISAVAVDVRLIDTKSQSTLWLQPKLNQVTASDCTLNLQENKCRMRHKNIPIILRTCR